MPDNQRLNYLLYLYLQERITLAESEELRIMIKSGFYDDEIKDIIDAELFLESGEEDVSPAKAQALLENILAAEKQAEAMLPMTNPRRRHSRWWLAAAVCIIAAMSWFWGHRRIQDRLLSLHPQNKQERSAVQQGANGRFIQLPDGSTVLLNGDSRLDYARNYGSATREVTLTGEAYFDVKHDTRHPFIVHTGRIRTIVLGTAFNIRAFRNQHDIRVTVTRGKVRVETDGAVLGTVTPNEQIAVNTNTNVFHLNRVNADAETQWKKQFLVLENISLGDAAVLIGDRYHVHILFANDAVRHCRITASFSDNEPLEQVLTVVCGVTGSSYTEQPNDQVVISGNGCD